MSNPLLLDIVLFLKTEKLVSDDGVDAFRDFIPEKPDSIVVVQEYTGYPAFLYDPSVHRSIQILARDNSADAARSKMVAIFKALRDAQSEVGVVDFTSTRWGQVHLRQTPFLLRRDKNDRTYYAINVGITSTIE